MCVNKMAFQKILHSLLLFLVYSFLYCATLAINTFIIIMQLSKFICDR